MILFHHSYSLTLRAALVGGLFKRVLKHQLFHIKVEKEFFPFVILTGIQHIFHNLIRRQLMFLKYLSSGIHYITAVLTVRLKRGLNMKGKGIGLQGGLILEM